MAEMTTRDRVASVALVVFGAALLGIGLLLVLLAHGAGPTTVATTGSVPDTTVITTPGHAALGSDVIDSFFLGAGAILLLSGIFYSRVSKIGLPGGGSIELNPVVQAKVAAAIGSKLNDPDQIAAAYHIATANLVGRTGEDPAAPSNAVIEAAAVHATSMIESGHR